MGKKSRRARVPTSGLSRREAIKARQEHGKNKIIMGQGDHRQDCDILKDCFRKTSKSSTNKMDNAKNRVATMQVFVDTMYELNKKTIVGVPFLWNDDDFHFTYLVLKDTDELAGIRAMAAQLLGIMAAKAMYFDQAMRHFQMGIFLCSKSTAEEEELELLYDGGDKGNPVCTMKQFLEERKLVIEDMARSILDTKTMKFSVAKGLAKGHDVTPFCLLGGRFCDFCGKDAKEMDLALLECCCSDCQLSYYCTRECQKKDWKDHKKVCRKPGEFKVGDLVMAYTGSEDNSQIGTTVLRVACPAPTNPAAPEEGEPDLSHKDLGWIANTKNWVVTDASWNWNERRSHIVPATELRRLRPLVWKRWHESMKLQATHIIFETIQHIEEAMATGLIHKDLGKLEIERSLSGLQVFDTERKYEEKLDEATREAMHRITITYESCKAMHSKDPKAVEIMMKMPKTLKAMALMKNAVNIAFGLHMGRREAATGAVYDSDEEENYSEETIESLFVDTTKVVEIPFSTEEFGEVEGGETVGSADDECGMYDLD